MKKKQKPNYSSYYGGIRSFAPAPGTHPWTSYTDGDGDEQWTIEFSILQGTFHIERLSVNRLRQIRNRYKRRPTGFVIVAIAKSNSEARAACSKMQKFLRERLEAADAENSETTIKNTKRKVGSKKSRAKNKLVKKRSQQANPINRTGESGKKAQQQKRSRQSDNPSARKSTSGSSKETTKINKGKRRKR